MNNKTSIDIKKLDKSQYTISLLQKALKCDIVSNNEFINIQIKILDLLKALTIKGLSLIDKVHYEV